jgi:hypothetical protein
MILGQEVVSSKQDWAILAFSPFFLIFRVPFLIKIERSR